MKGILSMQRTLIAASLVLSVLVFFILTCSKNSPLSSVTGMEIPHAFIHDSLAATNDTGAFFTTDTIHTGDPLVFIGIFDAANPRIKGTQWNFADGMKGTQGVVAHTYAQGGIFHAVFSVYDKVGDTLSDTVVVYVNTPPDSVSIVSPPMAPYNSRSFRISIGKDLIRTISTAPLRIRSSSFLKTEPPIRFYVGAIRRPSI